MGVLELLCYDLMHSNVYTRKSLHSHALAILYVHNNNNLLSIILCIETIVMI